MNTKRLNYYFYEGRGQDGGDKHATSGLLSRVNSRVLIGFLYDVFSWEKLRLDVLIVNYGKSIIAMGYIFCIAEVYVINLICMKFHAN